MASTIKVDNVQNQPGTNIINKCSVTTTIGAGAGETINVCGATVNIGRCGGTVALAAGATQTGFGRTGTVDWVTTPQTGTVTAATGKGYFVNTTSGTITVNLPAGVAGSIVAVSDYTRTFATYNCTVSPNGAEKIGGVAASTALDVNGQSATFVYVDGTEGWINIQETETSLTGNVAYMSATGGTPCSGAIVCTDYKQHTFTGPGTFCVSAVSVGFPQSVARNTVDFLIVAGGGGGGGSDGGGGGGAGGYRESPGTATGSYAVSPVAGTAAVTATASPYAIAVGGGGAAGPTNTPGGNGSTSTFSIYDSAGGGGGASECGTRSGVNGGSGGGGGNSGLVAGCGAAGNTPPTSPPQGKCGGNAYPTTSPPAERNGAGGGGATIGGTNGTSPSGGPGGTGATSSINATPTVRAGGGGGAAGPGKTAGAGGPGGGGAGATFPGSGTVGTVNTGGGGGGSNSCGVAGGSGIVILRYKFQN